jgi:hypothetical protein
MSLIQRENHVGIIKGSTWGTAVTPSNGVFVKAHTPPKGARKVISNEDEFGRGMATTAEVLEYEAQSGSMSLRVYSEGLEEIAASLMGKYGFLADEPAASGLNMHTFKLDTGIGSIFHTVAWDEGDEVKAVNSAKVVSGTFSYADGLNLDVNYMGDKVSITGWSALNSLSYPSSEKSIFKLSSAQVWINAEGGATLASGDALNPSGIDVAITRGFEALAVTAGSSTITEPLEKAAPIVEVTLTFPKKETATKAYFDAFKDRDFKKMQITFSGDDSHKVIFNFPRLYLAEAPDYAQDTPIPTTIKLKALKYPDDQSLPNGMTYDVPYIQFNNGAATLTGYPAI